MKSFSFMLWASLTLAACMTERPPSRVPQSNPQPATQANRSATPTPAIGLPTEVPTDSLPRPTSFPEEHRQGELVIPMKYGDAGNAAMQAGEEITVTWQDPPVDGVRYEFILLGSSDEKGELIGVDLDSSDGVAFKWTVPEGLSEMSMRGIASLQDGQIAYSHPSLVLYSGEAPPDGVCSISSATVGTVTLFERKDLMSSPEIAYLVPGAYATVYERTADEWYLVDASEALSTYIVDPMPESAWVYGRGDMAFAGIVQFHGPCDDLPYVDN